MKKLYYEYIEGTNDVTMVFLHGWGLSGKCFNKIVSKLDCGCNMILFDLFGFGKSPNPEEYFDAYEYAYQVFFTLCRCGVGKIILVGHSFGGRLSILLSSIFDLQVLGLVLTSSAGINKFELGTYLKIKNYKLCKSLIKAKILPAKILERFGSSDYKNANGVLRVVLSKVVNQDLSIWCKLIKSKTLLVWDKKDTSTKYYICKKLSRLIPNSRVVLYSTGGHFTAFVNSNKFASLLNSFCQEIITY